MKKLVLASLLTLGLGAGLVYAENKAAIELEHANKTAASEDGIAGDMSKMKAAGKCNADQSAKVTVKKKVKPKKPTKSELELKHANRLSTGDDAHTKGMGNMKAQGKCGSD